MAVKGKKSPSLRSLSSVGAGFLFLLRSFSFLAPAALSGTRAGGTKERISRRCWRRNLPFLPGLYRVSNKYSINEFGDEPSFWCSGVDTCGQYLRRPYPQARRWSPLRLIFRELGLISYRFLITTNKILRVINSNLRKMG